MPPAKSRELTESDYDAAARAYLRSLPLEHFMEATPQARQREITLESLAVLRARRADLQVFNELLVQYPRPGRRKLGQVVPDNMVVLSEQPIRAQGSFNVPREPAGPFWVLEYVSKNTPRKDYDDSFDKYEQELQVPYYLIFYPETQDLTLYRHTGKKYGTVKPNKEGRHAIPELELELGLLEGWVRFWYQGELLPLPADLQRSLDEARRRAEEEKRRADTERSRAEEEKRRADTERSRAEEEKRRADELQRRLEEMQRELAQYQAQASTPRARRNNHSRPSPDRAAEE
jgi:Uma2 family endonuclease